MPLERILTRVPDVVGASVVAIEASDEPGASKQVEQRSDRLCGGWGPIVSPATRRRPHLGGAPSTDG